MSQSLSWLVFLVFVGFVPTHARGQCESGGSYGAIAQAIGASPSDCESKAVEALLVSPYIGFLVSNVTPIATNRGNWTVYGTVRHSFSISARRYNQRWNAREYDFTTTQFPGARFVVQFFSAVNFDVHPIGQTSDGFLYSCSFRTRGCHGRIGPYGGGNYGRYPADWGPQAVRIFDGEGRLWRDGLAEDFLNPECPVAWDYACD